MRYLRSIFCAGLAMMAVAVCASMPAAAAVPIDVGISVQPEGKEYPAPAVYAIHEHDAVLPSAAAQIASLPPVRSTLPADIARFADKSTVVAAYVHIDPDIAG